MSEFCDRVGEALYITSAVVQEIEAHGDAFEEESCCQILAKTQRTFRVKAES